MLPNNQALTPNYMYPDSLVSLQEGLLTPPCTPDPVRQVQKKDRRTGCEEGIWVACVLDKVTRDPGSAELTRGQQSDEMT